MHTTDPSLRAPAYWVLRIGAALCFIGHGAFGFITKAAWVPYFGVVGVPERWAFQLMPMVGAVDVAAGMAVLFAPRGVPLVYMILWASWTALLRPLAGESVFETLERAGNYGVPLALLLLTGARFHWRALFARRDEPAEGAQVHIVVAVLRWTTVLLLAGHGALGALLEKPGLIEHYAAIGLPLQTVAAVGWFEIGVAALVAFRPAVGLLLFVAIWKFATESLFLAAGAPMWEVVERAGSYAAPLALASLIASGVRERRHHPATFAAQRHALSRSPDSRAS